MTGGVLDFCPCEQAESRLLFCVAIPRSGSLYLRKVQVELVRAARQDGASLCDDRSLVVCAPLGDHVGVDLGSFELNEHDKLICQCPHACCFCVFNPCAQTRAGPHASLVFFPNTTPHRETGNEEGYFGFIPQWKGSYRETADLCTLEFMQSEDPNGAGPVGRFRAFSRQDR